MLSVANKPFMLDVVMLSVVMLSVIMLSVVAPKKPVFNHPSIRPSVKPPKFRKKASSPSEE